MIFTGDKTNLQTVKLSLSISPRNLYNPSEKPGVLFMVQNPASHLALFCLLIEISSKNEIKIRKKYIPDARKNEKGPTKK